MKTQTHIPAQKSHEILVEEMNKLISLTRMRYKTIDENLSCDLFNKLEKIEENLEKDLMYLATCELKKLQDEKKFVFGKTRTARNSVIVLFANNRIAVREYKRKHTSSIDFVARDKWNEIKPFLSEKLSETILSTSKEFTEKKNQLIAELENGVKKPEKEEPAYGRRGRLMFSGRTTTTDVILLKENLIIEGFEKSHKDTYDPVKVCVLQVKFKIDAESYSKTTKYEISLFDNEQSTVAMNAPFILGNDMVYKKVLSALIYVDAHKEKISRLVKELERASRKDIDEGFAEVLVIRDL